jgi:hypothetical protein
MKMFFAFLSCAMGIILGFAIYMKLDSPWIALISFNFGFYTCAALFEAGNNSRRVDD